MNDEKIRLTEAVDLVRHELKLTKVGALQWLKEKIECGELEIAKQTWPGGGIDTQEYNKNEMEEKWETSLLMTERGSSNGPLLEWLIYLDDLTAVLYGKKQKGRPPEYPWSAIVAEAVMQSSEIDYSKQASMEKRLQQIALDLTGKEPSLSLTRLHAKAIIEAKRRLAKK